jgi:polar amino acid transport system substrate-binding protein
MKYAYLCHLLLLFTPSYSQSKDFVQEGKLTVGLETGFLPFEMLTPQQEWVGFDIDLSKAFAQFLKKDVVFFNFQFDGLIPALLTRKYDTAITGMSITPEREKVVLFSDIYLTLGLAIAISKDLALKVKTLKDLDTYTKNVAVKIGTTGAQQVRNTLKSSQVVDYPTETLAITAMLSNKVQAFVYDEPFIQIVARNYPQFTSIPVIGSKKNIAAAFHPSNKKLANDFNTFLKSWKKSGEFDKIYKKFFVETAWLKKFPGFLK